MPGSAFQSDRSPWVGLVHVRPATRKNPLGPGAKGAYGHVVALSTSREDYVDQVTTALAADHLEVVELDDVDTARNYQMEGRLDAQLHRLRERLSDRWPVQYGLFESYYKDGG